MNKFKYLKKRAMFSSKSFTNLLLVNEDVNASLSQVRTESRIKKDSLVSIAEKCSRKLYAPQVKKHTRPRYSATIAKYLSRKSEMIFG